MVSSGKGIERAQNGDRCLEKLRTNARRLKYEQRNLELNGGAGSCSSAGAQRRKMNKETLIPDPEKVHMQQFPHIFIRMILTQGRTQLDNRSGNQKTSQNSAGAFEMYYILVMSTSSILNCRPF